MAFSSSVAAAATEASAATVDEQGDFCHAPYHGQLHQLESPTGRLLRPSAAADVGGGTWRAW